VPYKLLIYPLHHALLFAPIFLVLAALESISPFTYKLYVPDTADGVSLYPTYQLFGTPPFPLALVHKAYVEVGPKYNVEAVA